MASYTNDKPKDPDILGFRLFNYPKKSPPTTATVFI